MAAKRLEVLADGICDAAVLIIFERMRPEDRRSVPWEARQRRKVEGGLKEVARLVPEAGFCVGNAFGLADIAVGTLLDYVGTATARGPLGGPVSQPRWTTDRLSVRPSFQETVPRPQQIDRAVV